MDNKKNKTQHMYGLVEQWKSSAQPRKVFCQHHDLKLSTFAYWIAKKKRMEEPSGGFLPIEVGTDLPLQITITYPNRVRISVDSADARLISWLITLWRDV